MADKLSNLSVNRQHEFNKRTLHATIGILNFIQVKSAFRLVLDQLIENFPDEQSFKIIDPDINVVTKMTGDYFGHAYVDLGKDGESLYNVLTGLNVDGTERKRDIIDPDWKAPPDFGDRPVTTESINAYIQGLLADADADHDYEDDWEGRQELEDSLREKYMPTIISIQDDPIIVMPVIALTREQMRESHEQLISRSTPNRNLYPEADEDYKRILETIIKPDPRLKEFINNIQGFLDYEWARIDDYRKLWMGEYYIPMPDRWDPAWDTNLPTFIPDNYKPRDRLGITIARSFVKEKPDIDKSILMCRSAPKWVTKEMVEGVFSKFNSDNRLFNMTVKENGKEVNIQGSYPYVRITPLSNDSKDGKLDEWGEPMNMITVLFSKNGDSQWDALFAEQMRKQVKLTAPRPSLKGETVKTIIFSTFKKDTNYVAAANRGRGGRGRGAGGTSRARGAVVSMADAAIHNQRGGGRGGGGGPPRGGGRGGGPPSRGRGGYTSAPTTKDVVVRGTYPERTTRPVRELPPPRDPNRSFASAIKGEPPTQKYPASPVSSGGMKEALDALKGMHSVASLASLELPPVQQIQLPFAGGSNRQRQFAPDQQEAKSLPPPRGLPPPRKPTETVLAPSPKPIASQWNKPLSSLPRRTSIPLPVTPSVELPAPSPAIWGSNEIRPTTPVTTPIRPAPTPMRTIHTPTSISRDNELPVTVHTEPVQEIPLPPPTRELPFGSSVTRKGPLKSLPPLATLKRLPR